MSLCNATLYLSVIKICTSFCKKSPSGSNSKCCKCFMNRLQRTCLYLHVEIIGIVIAIMVFIILKFCCITTATCIVFIACFSLFLLITVIISNSASGSGPLLGTCGGSHNTAVQDLTMLTSGQVPCSAYLEIPCTVQLLFLYSSIHADNLVQVYSSDRGKKGQFVSIMGVETSQNSFAIYFHDTVFIKVSKTRR